MWLGVVYAVLMMTFGWVVWMLAAPNRALRVVGALLMAHTVFGQFWPPMHQREVLAAGGGTLSDTLHVVLGGVTGLPHVSRDRSWRHSIREALPRLLRSPRSWYSSCSAR